MRQASAPSGPPAPGATIGIAGGGQLGRMLAMAAGRLGYRTIVFDPDPDGPAAQMANAVIAAGFDDNAQIDRFAAACDVVTYEFENVPLAFAERVGAQTPLFPPAAALETSQDRAAEKRFFADLGIATAPWAQVDTAEDLAGAMDRMDGPAILKTRRLGYDGKGQQRLADAAGATAAFEAIAGRPAIVEGLVAFDMEISIIAARGRDGAFAAYEPARNTHRDGILRESAVPCGAGPRVIDEAVDATRAIAEALDYIGVIGVEFFVASDGRLVANEFAPRVHNSGHWTEAACAVSQFEQHVRAVCGLPLGSTQRHSACVMRNLIGEEIARAGHWLAEPDAVLHLYGKRETRAGRKMGHVTLLARTGSKTAG